ncbi:ABC transporter ATP-binding protein [Variovorax sp. KK3]|uniref:ABC transporter ATP-binding protein n=1 Tax=Variovorax sp. KK3 TaxID=1855728 RepID=UPI00097C255D|nr:ABC transporter ATP-binding protein [Variovorax sp. KK3]
MADTRQEVLRVRGLTAHYGDAQVLHGMDFEVREGEVVSLLGRNGAGRTSTLRAILGLTGRRAGSVQIYGRETIGLPSHTVARLGLGYCPEERGIFANLSCEENLILLPTLRPGGASLAQIYAMFPNLRERSASPGTRLSGGEQQMLALARILRTGARLLLLDEISEGLAPVIVQALGRAIGALRAQGHTIVLVEQNLPFALPLADRHLLVEHGRVVADIAAADAHRPDARARFREALGV